ncbi:MAG: pilus assembly protein TadG-related protein, partial [Chloroflexota bacterium]
VALIIDGGSIYLNRRGAQTAADAAALAGAQMMCVHNGSLSDIQAIANQYAVTENGATAVESVTIDENEQVVVQTRVETPSFFAAVLGQDTDMARAEAAAGCFIPGSTTSMLPIAWTCQPPVGGSTDACDIHPIPFDVFEILLGYFNFDADLLDEGDGANHGTYTDGAGGIMSYLILDGQNLPIEQVCLEYGQGGTVMCDFNGDGIMDVEAGADRGWLLLPGTVGMADLIDILLNGFSEELDPPIWLPGKTGMATSGYIQAHAIKYSVALVPVFNAVCTDYTAATLSSCPAYDPVAAEPISAPTGNHDFYRVAGTAPFVVTCVSKGNSEYCPAKALSGADGNTKSIEGYFVDGYVAGDEIDPGGFDLGVYIISLTR